MHQLEVIETKKLQGSLGCCLVENRVANDVQSTGGGVRTVRRTGGESVGADTR